MDQGLIEELVSYDGSDLYEFVAVKAACGFDARAITDLANREFHAGVLPGMPGEPEKVGGSYRREIRMRPYPVHTIESVFQSDEVKKTVQRIRQAVTEHKQQAAKEARAEQLAAARLAKRRKAEQKLVPDLAARVEELEGRIAELTATLALVQEQGGRGDYHPRLGKGLQRNSTRSV